MSTYILHFPTIFGLEAVTRQELLDLGFANADISLEDGQVSLKLPATEAKLAETVALLNFSLRTCERVLLEVGRFTAVSFDALFDQAQALPWEDWLDPGYFIEIIGYSRKSQLFGVPAIQSLLKKAITNRLVARSPHRAKYVQDGRWSEDRNQGTNRVQFSIVNNLLSLSLDTTGAGLHKRGYRPLTHAAPIRESLAAGILKLAHFERNCRNYGERLWDPVCGSGTFVIEAALMLTRTAPGLLRHFAGEKMHLIGKPAFDRVREQLKKESLIYYPDRSAGKRSELAEMKDRLFGSDKSSTAVNNAIKNARRAGVLDLVNFSREDLNKLAREKKSIGTFSYHNACLPASDRILLVANPPYGERIGSSNEMKELHRSIADLVFDYQPAAGPGVPAKISLNRQFRLSVITADKFFEKAIGYPADKRRKLYNGMIECRLFQYFRH